MNTRQESEDCEAAIKCRHLIELYLQWKLISEPYLECVQYQAETNLKKSLLKDYDKNVIPIEEHDKPVDVKLGLSLIHMDKLCPKTNEFHATFYVKMSWNDPRLKWDPAKHENIQKILSFRYEDIWYPDVILYFGKEEITDKVSENIYTIIENTGNVLWVPPVTIKTHCLSQLNESYPPDIPSNWLDKREEFPETFFEQSSHELIRWCFLRYGSWVFDNSMLHLDLFEGDNKIDINYYFPTVNWELIDNIVFAKNTTYPCCPESPYTSITFAMKFRKMFDEN
ncbi:unnamed protein product [Gordionus sp. m RMFG-2023]